MIEPSHQPWSHPPSPSITAPVARPLWTLVGPGLSAVLAAYQSAALLGPLQSALQHDLGFTATVLAVVVGSHLLAVAVGLTPGYVLGRRAPTSVVLSALMAILVGAVLTALSGTPALLIAAGLVAGLGGGAVLGAAAGLTGQVGERRGHVRLTLGLAVFGGLLVGPLLSGFVSAVLSWRLAYLLVVLMTLVALVATAVGGVIASMRGSR